MNFDFTTKTFRDLLGTNFNQLLIPRFQRDYTWENEHTREFLEDLLSNSKLNNTTDTQNPKSDYFFGTILVAGNINGSNGTLEIIDGQQRITTATILLSTIGKLLKSCSEEKLSELIWEYIIKTTDDGEKITLLQNDTTDDFFKENVQDINITIDDVVKIKEAPDEETQRILDAIKFFSSYLSSSSIDMNLNLLLGKDNKLHNQNYITKLKQVRDFLLNSQVVCVSTTDKESANLIFEILNSKGKKLEPIDLIKNEIFKYVTTVQPKDYAIGKWKRIKSHLNERVRIEFSIFYRHFWLSKYKRMNNIDLYDQFLNNVSKEEYENFLDQLITNAEIYKKISSPNLTNDYKNQKQSTFIIDSLTALNNFKIRQCRVALLAIFRKKEEKLIHISDFKKIITFLPKFHFIYSALCSKRANTLESKYAAFAVALTDSQSVNDSRKIIDDLIEKLKKILPSEQEFTEKFTKLEFSNRDKVKKDDNQVTKYAIYELERIFSKNLMVANTASIEHIIPESKDSAIPEALNIGNLCILENNLNGKCDAQDIKQKFNIYEKSQFSTMRDFLNTHSSEFTKCHITNRSKYLANKFYESVKQA
ncbi:DUF262 domain-containing protein [Neisseria dentiae]|uniref:DUF262 domain-containing protein n=1 Tax=Neisseria dentiae TaxID=194197 RepID=UPI00211CF523|nr:DUF262 domain-containing HNH endonuclease family protein [Neisseria dentiae]MCQ9326519.1 DUF262 domain-containing HNH endonuclease family protein [Neisseria dentiae]